MFIRQLLEKSSIKIHKNATLTKNTKLKNIKNRVYGLHDGKSL